MEPELTPNHPAAIILKRREIRKSFLEWCRYALADRNMEPALHHRLIIDTLQKVTDGVLKRVMLLMPPGAAKSTYTSVLYTPWNLCVNPYDLVLACSYSYTLIEGFGRDCRDLIDRHSNVLGFGLSKTASAAGDWRISNGVGGYFCAGVNAGIAGHRADKGFIDDFIGTEEEADSQVIRDKNYWWYRNDFSPRLKPNASQIIIANRRHEDDLVGRLLNEEGDDWTVIRLPMVAEENDVLGRAVGDLLWPEWFGMNAEALKKVNKARKNPRTWAGLYQQRPSPEEGNFFKKEWLVEYGPNDLPKDLRMYVGSDYAVKKSEVSDRFCFLPAGMDSNGRLWILPSWFWQQSDTLEATEAMFAMATEHKPIVWWAGRENITGSIAPFLYKMMNERNVYVAIEELSESQDKQKKAQSIRGRMAARQVMFPRFAPDWEKARHELLTFPAGTHDDFVDALAKLGQGLNSMVSASPMKEPWDGHLPEERITCKWVEQSSKRKERMANVELYN